MDDCDLKSRCTCLKMNNLGDQGVGNRDLLFEQSCRNVVQGTSTGFHLDDFLSVAPPDTRKWSIDSKLPDRGLIGRREKKEEELDIR